MKCPQCGREMVRRKVRFMWVRAYIRKNPKGSKKKYSRVKGHPKLRRLKEVE